MFAGLLANPAHRLAECSCHHLLGYLEWVLGWQAMPHRRLRMRSELRNIALGQDHRKLPRSGPPSTAVSRLPL